MLTPYTEMQTQFKALTAMMKGLLEGLDWIGNRSGLVREVNSRDAAIPLSKDKTQSNSFTNLQNFTYSN